MSKRQDQLYVLERVKMYVAEGHLFAQSQSAIDIINEIIEQISKTETVVMKREISLINTSNEILKKEFAYHIADHIMKNGYVEPKPIGITNKFTEQYELEISFIKR